jgi:large subunit ribosomal protein L18
MAHSSRYRVQLRRRREQKTDYQARKAFVLSRKPRIVSRSSLKHTIVQIVVAKPFGDVVLASAHSKELVKKYGWKAATGNLPAAYLTGLLCGLKAKAAGVTEAILDIGLVSPTKGCKVFTVLSGVLDAGIDVPHSEEKILKDRAEGEHIVAYAESLGAPEEYAPQFSTYVAKKLAPEQLNEHFGQVKTAVFAAFGVTFKAEVKVRVKPAPKAAVKPEAKGKGKPEAKVAAKPEVKAAVKSEAKAVAKPEPKPEVKPETKAEVKAEAEAAEAKPKKAKAAAKPKKAPAAKAKAAEGKAKASAKSGAKKTTKAKTGGKKE